MRNVCLSLHPMLSTAQLKLAQAPQTAPTSNIVPLPRFHRPQVCTKLFTSLPPLPSFALNSSASITLPMRIFVYGPTQAPVSAPTMYRFRFALETVPAGVSDGVAVARYAKIAKEVVEMTERDAIGNTPLWYHIENWRASVGGSA